MSSDYSGTPHSRKLGIKEHMVYMLSNEPYNSFDLFDFWPESTLESAISKNYSCDFIHIFCKNLEILKTSVLVHKPLLKKNGMMWVSW